MYRSLILFSAIAIMSSCQSDNIFVQEDNQPLRGDVPSELIPFFESFQKEALSHGVSIDYERSNITAEFERINEGSVAGKCTTNGHNLRHITIDQNFWDRAPHLLREMIVYHELGHCVLGRGHREDEFANGICRSIMRSGVGECRDAYNANNRAYFVQELFEVTK